MANAIGMQIKLLENGGVDPSDIALCFGMFFERLLAKGFDETSRFSGAVIDGYVEIKAEKVSEDFRAIVKAVKAGDAELALALSARAAAKERGEA